MAAHSRELVSLAFNFALLIVQPPNLVFRVAFELFALMRINYVGVKPARNQGIAVDEKQKQKSSSSIDRPSRKMK